MLGNCRSLPVLFLFGYSFGLTAQSPSFTKVQTNVGAYAQTIAIADFNRDGHPDLALLYGSVNAPVDILLGKGDGTFSIQRPSIGAFGTICAAADFNRDGIPDLAGTDQYGTIQILPGNGDGTFGKPILGTERITYSFCTAGDLNGDQIPDIVFADAKVPGNAYVLLGKGDGTFQPSLKVVAPAGPPLLAEIIGQRVVLADLNGDRKLDLIVYSSAGNLSIALGNGDGTFRPLPMLPVDGHIQAVVVGDFNNDGKPELAVSRLYTDANYYVTGGKLSILPGLGDGTFGSPLETNYSKTMGPYGLKAGDFNRDGNLDLAVSFIGQNKVVVMVGVGNGTFASEVDLPIDWGLTSTMMTADMNGDGWLDLVVSDELAMDIFLVNPPALTISTTAVLPPGTVGSPYTQSISAFGGAPPYVNWKVGSGILPAGLSLGPFVAGASAIPFAGTPTAPGTYTFVLQVTDGAGTTATKSFTLTVTPAPPALTSSGVANGATYAAGGLVPGSWAQVKGSNISSVTRTWTSTDFVGLGNNLPTKLSGIEVKVNSLPAAVYYIDSGQVSFQVPAVVAGNALVQVFNNGVASNTVTAGAVSNSPGIFPVTVNGTNYAAAVFLDGKFAGDQSISPAFRNARPGEVVQLFATGLVPSAAGVLPAPQAVKGVTVTIGNLTVPADFAGLVAVGEFQINFIVPQQFADGQEGTYPISIQVNGVSSPLSINSNPPGPLVLPIQH